MVFDPELQAMSNVYETLKSLNNVQRQRILRWVKERLESELAMIAAGYKPAVVKAVAEPVVVKEEPVVKIVKSVEKTEAAETAPEVKPVPAPKPVGPKTLMDYETALELFSESNVKKATSRVLLMAAYLQERHGFKEISSYDINFRLKRIGFGVTNISSLINAIMTRVPHLLVQEGADEHTKQARRKFKVTPEGLALAKTFMKG